MSTEFEIIFTPDKVFAKEFANRTFSKTIKVFFYIFFPTTLFLALIAVLSGEISLNALLMIGVAVIGILTPTSRANWDAKNLLKQYAVLSSGDKVGIKVVFNEFEFSSNVYGRENTFNYAQISKVVSGKLGLYFHIEKSLYVMLKKDSFTVGDYDSFLVFLREKLKENPKALKTLKNKN